MRFAVAGGGVAGLCAALAIARAGHSAVVLERDAPDPGMPPEDAFDAPRHGIPHFQQPHTFLPRGRQVLERLAPDVLQALREAGAEEQDVSRKLHGPREPGDEDLVYLWVRRPLIEWALRRAVAAEPAVALQSGTTVTGVVAEHGRVAGVAIAGGEPVAADVVVDALGRYRTPPGWPRAAAQPVDCGAIYYSRYFELRENASRPEGPWLLNPRGDLGYMGFNTFRGDNRTFAVIMLVPGRDRELRILRDERAWMAACAAIAPLDAMTAPDAARPLTGVLPMGGLSNVLRAGSPGLPGVVAVGDALCHTNPSYAFGLSFALVHAEALARAAADAADGPAALADAYLDDVQDEVRERHAFACETDAARIRAWSGEPLDVGHRDGCYPLFAFGPALAAAPHDDLVLRRTIGRIGLLDRTATFDEDGDLHERIEQIWARLTVEPPPPPGPSRDELLALAAAAAAG